MGIEKIILSIKRRDSLIFSFLKDVYAILIRFDLPAPKFAFRPIYEVIMFTRFFGKLILEKLIYVPIFKSRCEYCGKGLRLPNGIPWIEGNAKIKLGENVSLDSTTIVSRRAIKDVELSIGDRTVIGYKVTLSVSREIRIGNDVMIAGGCFIADNDGHPIDPHKRLKKLPVEENQIKPINIEDNVWIGNRAIVLKGVSIGAGSVVAAHSVVTRDVPPYSVVMGIPARIIIKCLDRVYKQK